MTKKIEYKNNFENQGNCPNCNSDNLKYGDSGEEGNSYYYEFKCLDCGCKASEWYDLEFNQIVVDDE